MYPYPIRLSAAWELRSGRRNLPLTGSGPDRLIRSFGLPRQIDSYERVWLSGHASPGVVWTFNSAPLAVGSLQHDVSSLLRERNQLVAEVDGDWAINSVQMVIRCSAFLHEVKRSGRYVVGRVEGASNGPLELFLLMDSRRVGYQAVTPGERFQIELDDSSKPVRLELIAVSAIWDVVELD